VNGTAEFIGQWHAVRRLPFSSARSQG
jgi:hypothetical protein